MFRFATPYALLLLALLPLSAGFRRARQPAAMAMAQVQCVADLAPSRALAVHRRLPWILTLILVLLVTALARPQWGTHQLPVHTRGIDIILALDLSESMSALDFRENGRIVDRLAAVKGVVREFVQKRDGDRLGMVVFGSRAYTQMPLTHDHAALTAALDHLRIGAAGRATAIGDAIGIALKRLQDARGQSRVIVLLTDGASNTGVLEPLAAAEIARQMGIRIHAIGVGSPGRAPFLVDDPIFGPRTVYRPAELDEESLQTIADRTGGSFFRAKDRDALAEIYSTIDAMEKSDDTVYRFAEYKDLYIHLLVPAFVLLGFWVALKNTRLVAVP